MERPPNHTAYSVATNIVYQTPMAIVRVPIPAVVAAMFDIDTDQTGKVILAAGV